MAVIAMFSTWAARASAPDPRMGTSRMAFFFLPDKSRLSNAISALYVWMVLPQIVDADGAHQRLGMHTVTEEVCSWDVEGFPKKQNKK